MTLTELVDKAVEVVAPQWALRRAYARNVQRAVSDSAKRTRMNSHSWPSNQSPDLIALSDADVLRDRARMLVYTNSYARGVVRAIVRNVVATGIAPQARVKNGDTTDEDLNAAAESFFDRWQRRADITGRLSFYQLQALALAEVAEAGEVLVHFVESQDRSRPLPLALELVPADRIDSQACRPRGFNPETGNEVRRGVELNGAGEPVAYWLFKTHPNDIHSRAWQSERYPAEQFLHLFKPDRVGQTRGVSWFAPIINWLDSLKFYVDNELTASAVASCFSVAIKTLDGSGPPNPGAQPQSGQSSTDDNGNPFSYLQPGLVANLLPGEEVETINPGRPNSQAGPWINLMLRSMAVGMGLSFERLSRDYSQTNYSSNRASDLEDRREFRMWQEWLVNGLCVPVWKRFMESATARRVDGFPSAMELIQDYDRLTEHVWQPDGWEWVDPAKEQKAAAESIATNLSTLAEECGKRGRDWRDVLQQRATEKAEIERLGLAPQVVEPVSESPEDDTDDEPADETEEELVSAES